MSSEVPEEVETLHEKSLVEGRDVLKQADPEERKRWIDKQGQDWSGAFGDDPRAYTDYEGRKVAEPGRDRPVHDPVNPPEARGKEPGQEGKHGVVETSDAGAPGSDDSSESEGEEGREGEEEPPASEPGTRSSRSTEEMNKRSDWRNHRGLMQWKPARNAQFAKDEATYAMRKMKKKVGAGDLTGREPDIETET